MAPRAPSRKSVGITKRQFQDMLNARREMKYITLNDETTIPANGVIGIMSQEIVVGDTADQRDGSQINVSEINTNMTVILGNGTNDVVRFIVFADMQANGVYPAVTDIITSTDPNAMYSRLVTVQKRFKILHDAMITLTNVGSNRIVVHRKKIKLSNHKVFYAGTTSVESANGKGALYYYICGDEVTLPSGYNLDWSVSYYDS